MHVCVDVSLYTCVRVTGKSQKGRILQTAGQDHSVRTQAHISAPAKVITVNRKIK